MATLPIEEGLGWIGYIVFLIACFVAGHLIGKWHNKRTAAKRAAMENDLD